MGIPTGEVDENGADIEWPSDPEWEHGERSHNFKHPICQGTYGRINKRTPFKEEWRRKKRRCPCCGRMISSVMAFSTHGDKRKKNK